VFVGIHYIDRADRWRKYYPNGEQHEAYKQFILKEVLPLLEDNLPINPLGTMYSLMGDSLAGTFALLMGVEHNDIFKTIILQSPLIDDNVLSVVGSSITDSQIQIYHSIGLQEQ